MLFGLVEWWVGQARGIRYLVSLAFLLASTAALVFSDRLWPAGFAIGGVLLACTFLRVGEDDP